MNRPLLHHTLHQTWQRLTEPAIAVTDPEARRQARFLASFALSILVLVIPASLTLRVLLEPLPFWQNPNFWSLLVSSGVMAAMYALVRRGHNRSGLLLLIGYGTAVMFALALLHPSPDVGVQTFCFFILLTLLSSLFLSAQVTVAITLLHIGALLLLIVLVERFTLALMRTPLLFVVTSALIIILMTWHRQQLDADRQARIRASEARYRAIATQVSDIIMESDADGIIRYVSPSADQLDPNPEQLVGQPYATLVEYCHPHDFPATNATIRRAITERTPVTFEYRHRHSDGHYIWLDVSLNFLTRDGEFAGIVTVSRDVSERRAMEARLRASEERYRHVLLSITDHVYSYRVVDDRAEVVYMSERMSQLLDRNLSVYFPELRRWLEIVHPDDRARVIAHGERVIRDGSSEIEYRVFHNDGHVVWLRDSAQSEPDPAGGGILIFGVSSDISERKAAEDQLRLSEERYRIVTGIISDYAFFTRVQPDGSIERLWLTEESFTRLSGYTLDELNTLPRFGIVHPDDVPIVTDALARLLANQPVEYEHRILTKSGAVRWLRVKRQPVWCDSEQRVTHYYGAAHDITARKATEERLHALERQLSGVVNNLPVVVFALDRDGIVTLFEGNGVTLIDQQPGALVGYSVFDLAAENADIVLPVRQALAGQTVTAQASVNGVIFETIYTPVFDDAGQVTGVNAVGLDITARKQSEQQMMTLSLEQERLAMLRRFVHALSHDLRTPLALVGTSVDLTRVKLDPVMRERVERHLEQIEQQVKYLDRQLANLLSVTRRDEPASSQPYTNHDLNAIVRAVIAEQQHRLDERQQTLRCTLAAEPLTVYADDSELKRAIAHLIVNASAYSAVGSTIHITSTHAPNQQTITVRDTGIGIAPEHIDRIFEPLFRADDARQFDLGGMGLGLSVVRMVAEAHGGQVSVTSEPGVGSTFTLSLPCAAEPVV